jgi:hypothetical protein
MLIPVQAQEPPDTRDTVFVFLTLSISGFSQKCYITFTDNLRELCSKLRIGHGVNSPTLQKASMLQNVTQGFRDWIKLLIIG